MPVSKADELLERWLNPETKAAIRAAVFDVLIHGEGVLKTDENGNIVHVDIWGEGCNCDAGL